MNENFNKFIMFLRKWRAMTSEQKLLAAEDLIKNLNPSLLVSVLDEVGAMIKKIGL